MLTHWLFLFVIDVTSPLCGNVIAWLFKPGFFLGAIMSFILDRFAYTPMGTFGRLRYGKHEWFTVERPWLSNRSSISCIPHGCYTLRKYDSPTPGRGEVWQFNKVPGRTFIQIHKGNTSDDVVGCIAIGKTLGVVNGKWAVTDSRTAFNEMMQLTKDNEEMSICVVFNKNVEMIYEGL